MSRNIKSNQKKPFCKVCHDTGKPESEYTSHWVKDLNGNTLCPTLLNTECRYCYKTGHTAKFCSILVKKEKDKERKERQSQFATQKTPAITAANNSYSIKNKFSAIQADSDSESDIEVSEQVVPIIEKFPVLGQPKQQAEVKTGWAAIAAKPKETDDARYIRELEERSAIKSMPQSALKPKPEPTDYSKKIYTKSWADWTDSDTEDEEDEQEEVPVFNKVAVNYDSDW